MRRSSFVLEFRIEDAGTGQVVAEARNVLVNYDYTAGRSTPIPPELRARIKAADPRSRKRRVPGHLAPAARGP